MKNASTLRAGSAVSTGGGFGLTPIKEPLRIVTHIDMDAFYAQIEQVRDVNLTGKPVAVVQYPTVVHNIKDMAPDDYRIVDGSASSIIAVSYEARKFGVKRNMKGSDARDLCPELTLVQVPTRNAKADISLYRQNGARVVTVLEESGGGLASVEKASIDEVYVDVTRAAHALLKSLEPNPPKRYQPPLSNDSRGDGIRIRDSHNHLLSPNDAKDTDADSCPLDGAGAQPELDLESATILSVSSEEYGPEDEVNGAIVARHKTESNQLSMAEASIKDSTASERETQQMVQSEKWQDMGLEGWAAVLSATNGTYVAGRDGVDSAGQDGARWWMRPLGHWGVDEKLLACGAAVVTKLRAAVRKKLSYTCTAGVAHNKLLAKLCSNMHKPNAQTVLPWSEVESVFAALPVERVRGWGGKLGVHIKEKLGVSTAGEVAAVGPVELQRVFGEVEGWRAWEKARGIDREVVKARSAPKSIGCSKTFPGRSKVTSMAGVERWLSELSKELCLRLTTHEEMEGQTARTLTVSFAETWPKGAVQPRYMTRCCKMVKPEVRAVVEACSKLIRGYKKEIKSITMLGVSAHNFEDTSKHTKRIESFFGAEPPTKDKRSFEEPIPAMVASANTLPRHKGIASLPSMLPLESKVGHDVVSEEPDAKEGGRGDPNEDSASRSDNDRRESEGEHGADRVYDHRDEATSSLASGLTSAAASADNGTMIRDDSVVASDAVVAKDFPTANEIAVLETPAGAINTTSTPVLDWAQDLETTRYTATEAVDEGGVMAKEVTNQRQQEEESWIHADNSGPDKSNGEEDEDAVLQRVLEESRKAYQARHNPEQWNLPNRFRQEPDPSLTNEDGLARGDEKQRSNDVSSMANGEPRILFGRGGDSGSFGCVDPGVLAELPSEIQREIWMQQGKNKSGLNTATELHSRLSIAAGTKRRRDGRFDGNADVSASSSGASGGARRNNRQNRGAKQGRISSFLVKDAER